MNSCVKYAKSIIENGARQTTVYDAEVLTAYRETSPKVVAHILPPPLKPAKQPLGGAFPVNYPKTNFSQLYQEAAIFVYAEFNGRPGNYCIGISVDEDMAMAMGRAIHGFPTKMAKIASEKDGNVLSGRLPRHGIDFLSITAALTGQANVADGRKQIDAVYNAVIIVPGPAWLPSMSDWEWIMKTNVGGAILGQKVLIPTMPQQGNGCRIVNTASIAGLVCLNAP